MVVVWTEVPLAVVTVGRQSKSWSPSLSCCSGPWNVGVGQPSKLVAQQARGSSRTTDRSQVNRSRSRSRNGCWWRTGRVQLAMLKWSMTLLAQDPLSFPLSLSSVLEYSGRSAGCLSSRRDSRVGGSMACSRHPRMELAGWLRVLLAWAGLPLPVSDLLRYRG
jgi:hypothetical protein